MSRLPRVERENLDPDGQAVWDRIAAVRHGVRGPYGMLIHVPPLADRARATEDYFRFDASLPPIDRELVILAVAREFGAPYAWARHEGQARELGVREEVIEALRAQGALDALAPRERLLVEVVQSLLRTHELPEDLFNRGRAELGDARLVEMIGLMGHYCMVGLTLKAFQVPPPEE